MRSIVLAAVAIVAGCFDDTVPPLPDQVAGRCRYQNEFADQRECRDYLGPWDIDAAAADCEGWGGSFERDRRCSSEEAVGWCVLDKDSDTPIRVSFEEGSCGENERGCEIFGGGVFLSEGRCGSRVEDPDEQTLSRPFPEPEQLCVDPPDDAEPGDAAGGAVCQLVTMQGCTEPGRTWDEYGSCDIPREQRPYYPAPLAPRALDPDPRMEDPAYAAELAWVKQELSSCACFCCHSEKAPEGPSNWFLEQPGNFINGLFDTGVAQGAGVISSDVLGDLEPEQNNGFTRLPSIFPSTDPARMQAFFARELEHRGLTATDFDPIGDYGPLTEQDEFAPAACAQGQGIDADGALRWTGGAARIVMVLEEGSANPGVPPNRDTPEGTLWRLDATAPTERLIASGVRFGERPPGSAQRAPSQGAPPTLVEGERYYLYVAADYLEPITRCLFVR